MLDLCSLLDSTAMQIAALRLADLSGRERDVLRLIIRGMTSREVAVELAISPRTVEFHRTAILHKLGTRNAIHLGAIVAAVEFGGLGPRAHNANENIEDLETLDGASSKHATLQMWQRD